MTVTLDRRQILTAAVLTGATAFGSLAPEDAFAAPAFDVEPGAVDPNFAEGRVSTIGGSKLFVTGSDGVFHRILVTEGTSIWKLDPVDITKIAVGDGLYARGVLMPDGTLAAESIWVNIVNLEVHVTAIGHNVVHMEHFGSKIVGHVVPGKSASVYNGTPAVSDMSLLKVGQHIKVIGAWHPDTNEISIATVYAAV